MRSSISGYVYMFLILCILLAGVRTDMKHWVGYDTDSCGTSSEAYITATDELNEVEIAIRQSEQAENSGLRILPERLFRKLFFADLDGVLPPKFGLGIPDLSISSDYEKEASEVICPSMVMIDYVHRKDGMKLI